MKKKEIKNGIYVDVCVKNSESISLQVFIEGKEVARLSLYRRLIKSLGSNSERLGSIQVWENDYPLYVGSKFEFVEESRESLLLNIGIELIETSNGVLIVLRRKGSDGTLFKVLFDKSEVDLMTEGLTYLINGGTTYLAINEAVTTWVSERD